MSERKKIGLAMQNWHSSMGDPIYAVGSYYFSDMEYPKREVVEEARDSIESMIPRADAGAHGWTKKDAAELRRIKKYLDKVLAKGGAVGSDVRPGDDIDIYITWAGGNPGGKPIKSWFSGYKFVRMETDEERRRFGRGTKRVAVVLATRGYNKGLELRYPLGDIRRHQPKDSTPGRAAGSVAWEIAPSDRKKVIMAVYKRVSSSDRMLRAGKHIVMLTGNWARNYGVDNYTNITLEDLSNAELYRIAYAMKLLGSSKKD